MSTKLFAAKAGITSVTDQGGGTFRVIASITDGSGVVTGNDVTTGQRLIAFDAAPAVRNITCWNITNIVTQGFGTATFDVTYDDLDTAPANGPEFDGDD